MVWVNLYNPAPPKKKTYLYPHIPGGCINGHLGQQVVLASSARLMQHPETALGGRSHVDLILGRWITKVNWEHLPSGND